MAVLLRNNAVSRLASSLTASATTLAVMSGEGARFPSPTGDQWFPLSLVKSDGTLEIVKCTARSGDVFTVVRAQESTASMAFEAGDRVELRATAGVFAEGQQKTADAQQAADNAQQTADNAYNKENILGTVSQSGGVPTGAIIERGSNANGEYVRFADGTQICLKTIEATVHITLPVGSIFYGTQIGGGAWPAGFSVSPRTFGQLDSSGGLAWLGSGFTPNASYTAPLFSPMFPVSTSQQLTLRLLAIGRWY